MRLFLLRELGAAQHGAGAVDQQHAQVDVAAFAHAAESAHPHTGEKSPFNHSSRRRFVTQFWALRYASPKPHHSRRSLTQVLGCIMRYILLGIAFVVVTNAAEGANVVKCNLSGTQAELNACAYDEFEKADKELNDTYKNLPKKRGLDEIFVQKMRKAQQSWLAFRDAELEALFACESPDPGACWGSMYPMSYMSEKARLTRERTEALRAILREAQNN